MTKPADFIVPVTLAMQNVLSAIQTGFDSGIRYWGHLVEVKGDVPAQPTDADGWRVEWSRHVWALVNEGCEVVIFEHGGGEANYDDSDDSVLDVECLDDNCPELPGFMTIRDFIAAAKLDDEGMARVRALIAEDDSLVLETDHGAFEVQRRIGKLHTLTRAGIMKGLEWLSVNHPRRISEIASGDDDAETGDVLLQAALFEEIVYG